MYRLQTFEGFFKFEKEEKNENEENLKPDLISEENWKMFCNSIDAIGLEIKKSKKNKYSFIITKKNSKIEKIYFVINFRLFKYSQVETINGRPKRFNYKDEMPDIKLIYNFIYDEYKKYLKEISKKNSKPDYYF